MIKIVLEIKEQETENFKNIKAIGCEVGCKEIGKNATITEHKVSKMLKERMGLNKKIEFVNESSKTKEDLIEELLKNL